MANDDHLVLPGFGDEIADEELLVAQRRLKEKQAEIKAHKLISEHISLGQLDLNLLPISNTSLPIPNKGDKKEEGTEKAATATKKRKRLVDEMISIMEHDASEMGMISYMAQMLVQMTLPHSELKGTNGLPVTEYCKKNGRATLTIMTPSIYGGIPFGVVPRQLLMWLTTEAVRTKQREIFLGASLTAFLRDIGIQVTGGKEGSLTRFKRQSDRLFNSFINYDPGDDTNALRSNLKITSSNKSFSFWQSDGKPAWESHIVLDDEFYQSLISNPVPIDKRAIRALAGNAFALDMYCWLTWRMYSVKKYTKIPWEYLQMQFGAGYKDLRFFRRRFAEVLNQVLAVYPANVSVEKEALILQPSGTSIRKLLP